MARRRTPLRIHGPQQERSRATSRQRRPGNFGVPRHAELFVGLLRGAPPFWFAVVAAAFLYFVRHRRLKYRGADLARFFRTRRCPRSLLADFFHKLLK